MDYYYFHIWAVEDLDYELSEIDHTGGTANYGRIALEIDQHIKDSLFEIWPLFFCSEALKLIIEEATQDYTSFIKITDVKKGPNLKAIHSDLVLPDHFWLIRSEGIPMKDDFAFWGKGHIVVSETMLHSLRLNGVIHAESDKIEMPINEYFGTEKNLFWMKCT